MKILVFGDNIAHGFFDSRGGWVQRLAADFHSRTLAAMKSKDDYFVEVYNLSVFDDVADGVLARIEDEAYARKFDGQEDVIVVAVGINDSALVDNEVVQDVYKFQETLESLIKKAKSLSDQVVFVGLSAVDEELTDPWGAGLSNIQLKNNRINLFEDTVKQVAVSDDVGFIPVHDKFMGDLEAGHSLLSDGFHPNNLGHELIYQIVKPSIEELLQ